MTDRTPEYWSSIERAWLSQGLPEDGLRQVKASCLLKPKRSLVGFANVSKAVADSIDDLRDFIRLHQKDYLAGKYSEADRDKIECEVGLFVKACTQQVEQLKNSVLAAQGSPQAPAAAVAAQRQAGAGPSINEQTAAHLHGVVLLLAEQLHTASAKFDKFRAQRYQQIMEREARRTTAALGPAPAPAADTPAAVGTSGSQPTSPGSLTSSAPTHRGSSSLGAAGEAAAAAVKEASASFAASRIGANIIRHVRGTQSTLQKVMGDAVGGIDTVQARGTGWPAGEHRKDSTGPGLQQPSTASKLDAQVTGRSKSTGQLQNGTQPGRECQPQQQQQQILLQEENQRLAEQLASRGKSVLQVERSVREVAMLNQMFSSAVLHQAEAIEAIYAAAVEASQNIRRGNQELRSTIKVNRSTQRHILILLLAASLGLLFLDWFNS